MALFSFYKVRKPRQFNYHPVCWDAKKEALEERIEKVKREIGEVDNKPENYKATIKGTFIEGTTHLKKSKKKGHSVHGRVEKNIKLLLILALLSMIFWYFFIK